MNEKEYVFEDETVKFNCGIEVRKFNKDDIVIGETASYYVAYVIYYNDSISKFVICHTKARIDINNINLNKFYVKYKEDAEKIIDFLNLSFTFKDETID